MCQEQGRKTEALWETKPSSSEGESLGVGVNGLHSQTTPINRTLLFNSLRLHLGRSRQVNQDGTFRANNRNDHGGKASIFGRSNHHSKPWPPRGFRLRQRQTVHVKILDLPHGTNRNQTENVDGIPPAIRWTNGTNQPDVGEVPEKLRQFQPR